MNNITRFFAALLSIFPYIIPHSQTNFTWFSGSSTFNATSDYGNVGIEAANNHPGARENSASWTTTDGKLWLFGGKGLTASQVGFLSDLWSFDLSTNLWTWRGGSDNTNNMGNYVSMGTATSIGNPSKRQNAATWVGKDGCLYLFGGQQTPSNNPLYLLNDLWKFNPNTNQWTWLSGSSNTNDSGNYGMKGIEATTNCPPSRFGAQYWTDTTGTFWLFGGRTCLSCGTNVTRLNDLWKYDIVTNVWTWVGGSNQPNQTGTYGIQNTASAANVPGARQAGVTWTDVNNNLWLFGGDGFSIDSNSVGYLSDLWQYNITNSTWNWVKGPQTIGIGGNYGTLLNGTPSTGPGSRQMSVSFGNLSSKLWLFGGWGQVNQQSFGRLNDLWSFDISTLNWTWEAGCNCSDSPANYGILGLTSSSNKSGARRMSTGWEFNNNFYFFGGNGYDINDSLGLLGDLWKINPGQTNLHSENISEFHIWPNPASSTIHISGIQNEVELIICDLKGIVLLSQNLFLDTEIELPKLSSGAYLLKIGNITQKFIISE